MRRPNTNGFQHMNRLRGIIRNQQESTDRRWMESILDPTGVDWRRMSGLLTPMDCHRVAAVESVVTRFRSLMELTIDAACFLDGERRIILFNAAAEKLFGYPGPMLKGMTLETLIPALVEADCRFATSPNPAVMGLEARDLQGRRADGTEFPVTLTRATVVPGVESLVLIRDETQRRHLECEVLEAAAIECRRIGQDLHDVTGQELTALSLFASGLAKLLEQARPAGFSINQSVMLLPEMFQKLVDTVSGLRQGLADAARHAHDLSHGILPFPIEPTELEDRLQALCEMISGLRSIHCRVSYPPEVRHINSELNCDTSTQLYRIVQEAVTNAVKHGHADEIQIALRHSGDRLTLEVRDNGTGMSVPAARPNGNSQAGAGLKNMAYRARQIGGILETEACGPGSQGGMVVRCVVPLRGH